VNKNEQYVHDGSRWVLYHGTSIVRLKRILEDGNGFGSCPIPVIAQYHRALLGSYDALPIHFCNSASGTLRPCSGRI
jgi:hypothetical protein